jgi:FtsP/CotA-like multicopper oxidase with cupredoxin domain
MSRAQRLTFLGVAAIIAVVAVIVLSGGGDETDKAADATATPTVTPSATASGTAEATATPTPKPKPKPPLLQAGKEPTLSFDQGDTVRFRVRHGDAEEVHVHGYDIKKDLAANETANVSFEASIPGIFEIELEHSGTPLGRLKVEP